MRTARIKVDAGEGVAVYHVMTRTVNGEHLLDDVAKEVLRKQLWQVADFCGVQVCTFALMSNHFHVLLRVPQKSEVTDAELLRRYAVLYPKPTKYQTAQLDVIRGQLVKDGPEAVTWRSRQVALMGDVSQFMKLLKQRFSVWFNRSHGRYGTLWAERFKSVLVEGKSGVMRTMAAYIDLNPVRAGLVEDPKDYRFCGYAEAVAGNATARRGLDLLFEGGTADNWRSTQSAYRQILFGTAAGPREHGHHIDSEAFERVVAQKGQLPLQAVLRCRVRHFTDGAVLGSKAFVAEQLNHYRRATGRRERTAPRDVPRVTDWGDLCTLRGLRKHPFG
ncbi:transposase [Synoicihabitans lomoniglobus]|uniref:Transposase n=1 Tax=Synoicihabitans lomoniglobus TaxID=2909285 RepID=A0AAF0I3Z9_9BACT|nr:transposase [Opitutaceae bacterium LMO-M01]WED66210.1 transposase [Opitutaceae bacterium LMO-M01]